MAQTSLFHKEEEGSTPIKSLKVYKCKFKDIRHLFEKYHYKGGHMGGGISFCLKLIDRNENIIGGMVFGKLRHDKAYSGGLKKILEIRRMACEEDAEKNTESYFLSKAMWHCKKNEDVDEIITYSDLSVGHNGTIYKAANFTHIGKTKETKHVFWNGVRYHPRSLTIERPYSYKLREAVKTGEAIIETGKPKLIFKYQIKKYA
jgi:hypothetical protein